MGALPFHERVVVHHNLDVQPGDQHRVAVQVVDNRIQREAVLVLDDAEPEAIPLQRIGRGQYVVLPFELRQHAVLFWGQTECHGGS